MKLVTFVPDHLEEKVGGILSDGRIVDLLSAWAEMREKVPLPMVPQNEMDYGLSSILHFLQVRDSIKEVAEKILNYFEAIGRKHIEETSKKVIYSPNEVKLLPPITQPGKIIAMGRNFSEHLQESRELWKEKGRDIKAPSIPVGFVKVNTTLLGHEGIILCPQNVHKLDYELELAIVIGKRGKHIPKERAFEYIGGYMIFNDISARDVQVEEMQNQLLLLGKNFDAFGPMGPSLVLREEVVDPQNLTMRLKVNGEIRQNSSTRYMIFNIAELVQYWSQMTLEPGDIIASGTPSGVAFSRKADQASWFLKPGDILEAEIEGLGILRNRIEMAR